MIIPNLISGGMLKDNKQPTNYKLIGWFIFPFLGLSLSNDERYCMLQAT